MEIEVRMTVTKLSKSIVNQMQMFSNPTFEDAECLGFVCNVRKRFHKVLIIKVRNNYYYLPFGMSVYDKSRWKYIIGIWSKGVEIRFETEKQTDEWIGIYDQLIQSAQQIYI